MSDDVTSVPPDAPRRRPPVSTTAVALVLVVAAALAVTLLGRRRHATPPGVPEAPARPTPALDAAAPLDHPGDVPAAPAVDAALEDVPFPGSDVLGSHGAQTTRGGGPEVLAIFTPLRPGSMLGAARIDHISEVVMGRILVDVSIGERRGTFAVMLASPAASRLVRAGPYVLSIHGEAFPELFPLTPLLADALRLNSDPTDAPSPPPAGLRPFAMDRPMRR